MSDPHTTMNTFGPQNVQWAVRLSAGCQGPEESSFPLPLIKKKEKKGTCSNFVVINLHGKGKVSLITKNYVLIEDHEAYFIYLNNEAYLQKEQCYVFYTTIRKSNAMRYSHSTFPSPPPRASNRRRRARKKNTPPNHEASAPDPTATDLPRAERTHP